MTQHRCEQPPLADDLDRPRRRKLREWLRAFLVAFLVVAPFRSAVADWNDVPTGSMRPTIEPGDRILVDKLAYDLRVPFTMVRLAKWSDPARGDVVVLDSPVDGIRLVKRVVAVPGDLVELRSGRLLVNGEPAEYEQVGREVGEAGPAPILRETVDGRTHLVRWEPSRPARRNLGPLRIPTDRYLLLGDNRDNSADSRVFGLVERELIVGRAVGVVWSFDPEAWIDPRWERFFQGFE